MGTGTRHLLGVITGVVAIPVVSALTVGGLGYIGRAYTTYITRPSSLYVAAGLIVLTGVLVALLVGTRISPLASLLPGVVFTALGAAGVVAPEAVGKAMRSVLPMGVHVSGAGVSLPFGAVAIDTVYDGGFLLIGVIMVIASIAPSRWRAKVRAVPPGSHRVAAGPGPEPEEPWPPQQPAPSDPAMNRATPPLPSEAAAEPGYPAPEYPYGPSGPQQPYGGPSGPQAPYGQGSGPQTPYGAGPGPQTPYGPGSGPQAPYGTGSGPQEPYGAGHAPQAPYGTGSGAQEPYGRGSVPRGPFEEATGYGPGDRPSSWSGPQAPYAAGPGPGGADPYAGSAFGGAPDPWGPPPAAGDPPTRAFSAEGDEAVQSDPTPRTMPDANANDATHRIPWSDADRDDLRDRPDR